MLTELSLTLINAPGWKQISSLVQLCVLCHEHSCGMVQYKSNDWLTDWCYKPGVTRTLSEKLCSWLKFLTYLHHLTVLVICFIHDEPPPPPHLFPYSCHYTSCILLGSGSEQYLASLGARIYSGCYNCFHCMIMDHLLSIPLIKAVGWVGEGWAVSITNLKVVYVSLQTWLVQQFYIYIEMYNLIVWIFSIHTHMAKCFQSRGNIINSHPCSHAVLSSTCILLLLVFFM